MYSMPTPANELLAALERYQRNVKQLAAHWRDAELHRIVSQHSEEIRRGCRALPAVSAQWVGLLIAHAELLQALWRSGDPRFPMTAADRERLLAAALEHVHELQQACMTLARRAPDA